MKFRFVIIAVCCFFTLAVRADEGMWMLGNLDKQTRRTMKELVTDSSLIIIKAMDWDSTNISCCLKKWVRHLCRF